MLHDTIVNHPLVALRLPNSTAHITAVRWILPPPGTSTTTTGVSFTLLLVGNNHGAVGIYRVPHDSPSTAELLYLSPETTRPVADLSVLFLTNPFTSATAICTEDPPLPPFSVFIADGAPRLRVLRVTPPSHHAGDLSVLLAEGDPGDPHEGPGIRSVAARHLPGPCLLLATGHENGTAILSLHDAAFETLVASQRRVGPHVARVVTGQDWVRGLDLWVPPSPATTSGSGSGSGATIPESVVALLATSNQDKAVRIWSLELTSTGSTKTNYNQGGVGVGVGAGAGIGVGVGAGTDTDTRVSPSPMMMARPFDALTRLAPKPSLTMGAFSCVVRSDSLLLGHEDWVFSARFRTRYRGSSRPDQGPVSSTTIHANAIPQLLTASMDRSLVIWEPQHDVTAIVPVQIWMPVCTVGDAGPSNLGYYSCAWRPDGRGIVANGYTGSLHLWRRECTEGEVEEAGVWVPYPCATGHTKPVVDAHWAWEEADGDQDQDDIGVRGSRCRALLLTASEDQTTRLWAQPVGPIHPDDPRLPLWCEVGRPQVHGHDFSRVAPVGRHDDRGNACGDLGRGVSYRYLSASEEKVIRVMEAPGAVLESLAAVRGVTLHEDLRARIASGETAVGASATALGLSNTTVQQHADHHINSSGDVDVNAPPPMDVMDGFGIGEAHVAVVQDVPLEEHLAQSSLWLERHKLYGHGDDLHSLAADRQGIYAASGAIARSRGGAAVVVWDVASWRPVQRLEGPTLTATELRFSRSGTFLAVAGRDRSLCLFRRRSDRHVGDGGGGDGDGPFVPIAVVAKAHARVVWSVDVGGGEGREDLVASAARDGEVLFWRVETNQEGGCGLRPLGRRIPHRAGGVHSLALTPAGAGAVRLALGLEQGGVEVWEVADDGGLGESEGRLVAATSGIEGHAAAVLRVQWDATGRWLASVGADHGVRIYDLRATATTRSR